MRFSSPLPSCLAIRGVVTLLMLCSAVGEGLFTSDVTFLTPPYLQNVRTDGIVIMTETDENVPLEVVYGKTEDFGSRANMDRVASGGGTWFHRVVLSGLTAETEYHYAVQCQGGEPLTDHAHFHTAPDREIDFKFSAWSDSQGHNRGAWTAAHTRFKLREVQAGSTYVMVSAEP